MRTALAAALGLALLGGSASAEDTVKLAVGQRGNWDTSVSELGQRAGIFKKHGLLLELLYTQGGGETQRESRWSATHDDLAGQPGGWQLGLVLQGARHHR